MPAMGFTKFERFFRTAGEVSVDRDDVRGYLDFVNDAIYDMLLLAQATAKANVRDVILPWDLPITAGCKSVCTGSPKWTRTSSSSPSSRRSLPGRRWTWPLPETRRLGCRRCSARSAWPRRDLQDRRLRAEGSSHQRVGARVPYRQDPDLIRLFS
jgi:Domain of unknown function (DUF1931)